MALSAALILSGVSQEQFSEDLHYMFDHGNILLRSPSVSSVASSSTSCSAESGISSLSSESETKAKSWPFYLDIIARLEREFEDNGGIFNFSPEPQSSAIKIIYENRDILDLADNLKSKWLFKYAVLRHGIENFFANRSQYSRVNGAKIPRHLMINCTENDCDFCEPKYY